MTTTSHTTTTLDTHRPARAGAAPAEPLRHVLAVDAGFCAISGAGLVLAAPALADSLDLAAPSAVRAVGAFLALLGVALGALARAPERRARAGAVVTAVGDVAWTAASIVLVVTAGFPAWADAVVVAQALGTLGIALAKRRSLVTAS